MPRGTRRHSSGNYSNALWPRQIFARTTARHVRSDNCRMKGIGVASVRLALTAAAYTEARSMTGTTHRRCREHNA